MSRFLSRAIFCNPFIASATLVAGLAATQAHAEDIALANHSFEEPPITIPVEGDPNFGDPFATIVNTVPGWIETGPTYSRLGREGKNDTGRFLNVAVLFPSEFGDIPVPALPSTVDGDHLGFFVVNPEANGQVAEDFASISQKTSAVFESETNYSFTLAIGSGVVFPASVDSTMVLSIGYFNQDIVDPQTFDAIGAFVSLKDLVVTQPEVDLVNFLLTDFTVDLLAADINSSVYGENVAVMVKQVDGSGNTYNIDNARLSSSPVPEPTSLALLGLGGMLVLRRRR